MLLAVLDSNVHQFRIFGLLGGGEDEGRVGGGILGLVLLDGYKRGQWRSSNEEELLFLLAKSPESQTTVCFDGQSTENPIARHWRATHSASGLQLVERRSHDCVYGF